LKDLKEIETASGWDCDWIACWKKGGTFVLFSIEVREFPF